MGKLSNLFFSFTKEESPAKELTISSFSRFMLQQHVFSTPEQMYMLLGVMRRFFNLGVEWKNGARSTPDFVISAQAKGILKDELEYSLLSLYNGAGVAIQPVIVNSQIDHYVCVWGSGVNFYYLDNLVIHHN